MLPFLEMPKEIIAEDLKKKSVEYGLIIIIIIAIVI